MTGELYHAVLGDRALVSVAGADWRRFLQGLVSNDVETLAEGELRFAALLTPQGKLLFDMFVLGAADAALLDVQAAQRGELIRRLTMYRLRSKVEIAAPDGEVSGLWGDAPDAPGWVRDPRLPGLGWRGYGASPPPGAVAASADGYDAHRLALGVPDPARDCVPDKTFPIEADFDLLNGIDFRKGCYVGQETTSRMKRRGAIKTRMLPIAFDGPPPPPGTEVLAGELRAGEVLSGRVGRAMALLRLDRIEGAALTAGGRPVKVVFPPWFPPVSGR
jgi:folate-binding protein YgfZ